MRRLYLKIKDPDHPRAVKGWVFEHLVIADKALGYCLREPHQVHHFDYDGTNNANNNLVICEDDAYHALLHIRQRIADLGGDPNTQKTCWKCKGMLNRTAFSVRNDRYDGLRDECKRCHSLTQGYLMSKKIHLRVGPNMTACGRILSSNRTLRYSSYPTCAMCKNHKERRTHANSNTIKDAIKEQTI